MLFFALYRVFRSVESLSFNGPAETGIVKVSATFAKVFMAASSGNRIRNFQQGKHMIIMVVMVLILNL